MKTAKSECKMMDKGRIYIDIYKMRQSRVYLMCTRKKPSKVFICRWSKKKEFSSRWEMDEETSSQGSMTSINRMRSKVQCLLYEENQLNDLMRVL